MKLWRIANKAFNTLEGHGGLYVQGRWHSIGKPIVYCADHPALAALEVLVHRGMEPEDLPAYVLMEIEAPDSIVVEHSPIDPLNENICRRFGDQWLAEKRSSLCRVPSVLMPSAYNFLINPLHPDASQVKIIEEKRFIFDGRLIG